MYYNKVNISNNIGHIIGRGELVVKSSKKVIIAFLLLVMGLFAGTLYASPTDESANVEESTYQKSGEIYECLVSDDGYLRITQIIPTSSDVRINTYVDDDKLLISGTVAKGTEIIIKVYNEVSEEEAEAYPLTSTGTFTQSIIIPEGQNRIIISYSNEVDEIEDYIKFSVSRIPKKSIEAIKNFIVTGA